MRKSYTLRDCQRTVFDINKETFTVNTAQMFENAMGA